jgi:hypothetical protein
LDLSGGGATDVVLTKRTDASPEGSKRESDTVHSLIIEGSEQDAVNIYNINENNLYGCSHVQLDIGDVKLKAVFDRGEEISLRPEGILRIS